MPSPTNSKTAPHQPCCQARDRYAVNGYPYHYSTSIYETPEKGRANYELRRKQDRVKAVIFSLATEELQKERVGQAERNEQYVMQRFELLKDYPGEKFDYDWWKREVTEEFERLINKYPETNGAIKMRAFVLHFPYGSSLKPIQARDVAIVTRCGRPVSSAW